MTSQFCVGRRVGEQNPVVLVPSVTALTLGAEESDNLEQLPGRPKRSSNGILESEQLLAYRLAEQDLARPLVNILLCERDSSNHLPSLDGKILRRFAPEASGPISASVDRLKRSVYLG
jgi:hypothetical protein